MQSLIITELLKIKEGKVTTNYRILNLDGQEPVLNNKLGFIPELNQYVPVTIDKSDKSGRTFSLETTEKVDNKDIIIQYTNVVDLKDYKVLPVIKTEKSILTSKVIELQHEPRNLFGLCPMLNFGYVLVRSPAHGTSIKVPSAPCKEDETGKSIQLQVSDEQFEQLKDKEVTVQYIYEQEVAKVTEIAIPCRELVTFTNGLLTLSGDIGNLNDESPFLNFELANTIAERPLEFVITKMSDNACGSPFFSESDLEILEGQQVSVQYIKTVKPKDVKIDAKLLDTTAINGFPFKYSDLKMDESTKQDEKLQKIAKGFAENAPSTITRNGEIVDGEFTVIKE